MTILARKPPLNHTTIFRNTELSVLTICRIVETPSHRTWATPRPDASYPPAEALSCFNSSSLRSVDHGFRDVTAIFMYGVL